MIAAPKCNVLGATGPRSVIGMQSWIGDLMGITESSMAAMAPVCLSKKANQPGGLDALKAREDLSL